MYELNSQTYHQLYPQMYQLYSLILVESTAGAELNVVGWNVSDFAEHTRHLTKVFLHLLSIRLRFTNTRVHHSLTVNLTQTSDQRCKCNTQTPIFT